MLFSVLGCGAEDADGTPGITQDAALTTPDAASCAPSPCTCGSLLGTRSCSAAGALGECVCAPTSSTPDASVTFEGACSSGVYRGTFEGNAGFIITTTPVTGLDLTAGKPALELTLQEPANGEFISIGKGTMRGNANATFPFEATIDGQLDCRTKQFKATIVGSVQLFLDGIRNDFTGTMSSSYDTSTNALTDGMWTVMGSSADGGSDLGLTGNGKWNAKYSGDGVSDAGVSVGDGGS